MRWPAEIFMRLFMMRGGYASIFNLMREVVKVMADAILNAAKPIAA